MKLLALLSVRSRPHHPHEPGTQAEPIDAGAGSGKLAQAGTAAVVNMLIRDGKTWRIVFDATAASLPNRVGFGYLQKLVANPHRPIDVHELKGVTRIIESRQPIFDAHAKRELQREYDDANAKVHEAEKNNDVERAEAARDNLRCLATRISAQGVPERALSSEAERIRTSVAKAIRCALKEIQDVHATAHAHLTQFLVAPASSSPCYDPRPTTVWQVNLTAVASHYQQVDFVDP